MTRSRGHDIIALMRSLSLIAKKKRRNIRRNNKIEKNLVWPLETILLKVVVRRKKAIKSAIIA